MNEIDWADFTTSAIVLDGGCGYDAARMANSESTTAIDLAGLGFNKRWAEAATASGVPGAPARVVRDGRDLWHIVGASGERLAALSGRFRRAAKSRSDWPAVGDWVMAEQKSGADRAIIHAVLPRATAIQRKAPGEEVDTQVVAANVDRAFIVCALDGGRNFHPRAIERYLALVRESGADAALILNKSDLCGDSGGYVNQARSLAPDTPICVTSAVTGNGIEDVIRLMEPGRTFVFVGPSGVGKSALVNRLMGEDVKETGKVRERDRRGRHTTTYRELLALPNGALVIDTPGLRELQLWGDRERLEDVYPDVAALAPYCRFTDCRHDREPGCAVRAAVEAGTLPADRLAAYHQLRLELEELAERRKMHELRRERRHRRVLQLGVDREMAPRKGRIE